MLKRDRSKKKYFKQYDFLNKINISDDEVWITLHAAASRVTDYNLCCIEKTYIGPYCYLFCWNIRASHFFFNNLAFRFPTLVWEGRTRRSCLSSKGHKQPSCVIIYTPLPGGPASRVLYPFFTLRFLLVVSRNKHASTKKLFVYSFVLQFCSNSRKMYNFLLVKSAPG